MNYSSKVSGVSRLSAISAPSSHPDDAPFFADGSTNNTNREIADLEYLGKVGANIPKS